MTEPNGTEPNATAEHYATTDLRGRIAAALAAAGLGEGMVRPRDLAALDQFHVRGLAATVDLATKLAPTPDLRVLDVGSGVGGPSRFLAATYGCHVTGIDLSAHFVDAAILLAERCGLADRVTYRQADALALPFADGTFDIVWTQHVAMNIADRAGLYREMHRVLKPGGRLAIYDVTAYDGTGMAGQSVSFPVPWARDPAHSFLLTPDAMRVALDAAGFVVESWTDRTADGLASLPNAPPAPSQPAPLPPAPPPPDPSQPAPSPLSLAAVMGPDWPMLAAGMARNLRDGRIGLTEAILRRA